MLGKILDKPEQRFTQVLFKPRILVFLEPLTIVDLRQARQKLERPRCDVWIRQRSSPARIVEQFHRHPDALGGNAFRFLVPCVALPPEGQAWNAVSLFGTPSSPS
jgi:hypothetical protein